MLYQNDNKTKPDIGSKYQCLTQRNPKTSLNAFSGSSTSTAKQLHYQPLHGFVIYTLLWFGNQTEPLAKGGWMDHQLCYCIEAISASRVKQWKPDNVLPKASKFRDIFSMNFKRWMRWNFKMQYCLLLCYTYPCIKVIFKWNIVSNKSSYTK